MVFPIIFLAALVCIPGWGQDQSWNRVAKLSPGDPIQVLQKGGHTVDGKFQSLSPESLTLEDRNQASSLALASIKQVSVQRKASRWKAAGVGVSAERWKGGINTPRPGAPEGGGADPQSTKY